MCSPRLSNKHSPSILIGTRVSTGNENGRLNDTELLLLSSTVLLLLPLYWCDCVVVFPIVFTSVTFRIRLWPHCHGIKTMPPGRFQLPLICWWLAKWPVSFVREGMSSSWGDCCHLRMDKSVLRRVIPRRKPGVTRMASEVCSTWKLKQYCN